VRDTKSYEQYVANTAEYFAAIEAAGDLPWWQDRDRRAIAAARLGIPDDDPDEVRRALFMKHRKAQAA
jgi:hypothetical protein